MQLIKWSDVKLDQKIFFPPGKHSFEPTAWFLFKEEYSEPNNVSLAQKEYHVLDESKCTRTRIFKASI